MISLSLHTPGERTTAGEERRSGDLLPTYCAGISFITLIQFSEQLIIEQYSSGEPAQREHGNGEKPAGAGGRRGLGCICEGCDLWSPRQTGSDHFGRIYLRIRKFLLFNARSIRAKTSHVFETQRRERSYARRHTRRLTVSPKDCFCQQFMHPAVDGSAVDAPLPALTSDGGLYPSDLSAREVKRK
ncbi:hypothetical protein EVAR_35968_1 [Eumeta japonica]|uniref:Uncharacterized protein n=1 Tax=Eumeta variegata TaxID=151549 RepID=A0A4C1W5B5_EUMVA|nr:hypothetical protein EVAR_35968_1 [Eumeta japonica]